MVIDGITLSNIVHVRRLRLDWSSKLPSSSEVTMLPVLPVSVSNIIDPTDPNCIGRRLKPRYPAVLLFMECYPLTRTRFQPNCNHRKFDLSSTFEPTELGKAPLMTLMESEHGETELNASVAFPVLLPYMLEEENRTTDMVKVRSNSPVPHKMGDKEIPYDAVLDNLNATKIDHECFDRLLALFRLKREKKGEEVTLDDVCRFLCHVGDYRFETKKDIQNFFATTEFKSIRFKRGTASNVVLMRQNLVESVQLMTNFRLAAAEGQHRILAAAHLWEGKLLSTDSAVFGRQIIEVMSINMIITQSTIRSFHKRSKGKAESMKNVVSHNVTPCLRQCITSLFSQGVFGVTDKSFTKSDDFCSDVTKYFRTFKADNMTLLSVIADSDFGPIQQENRKFVGAKTVEKTLTKGNMKNRGFVWNSHEGGWDSKEKHLRQVPFNIGTIFHLLSVSNMFEDALSLLLVLSQASWTPEFPQLGVGERIERFPWNDLNWIGNWVCRISYATWRVLNSHVKEAYCRTKDTRRAVDPTVDRMLRGLIHWDILKTIKRYGLSPNDEGAHPLAKKWRECG